MVSDLLLLILLLHHGNLLCNGIGRASMLIRVEKNLKECKADASAALRGATPFEFDRGVLKDIVS
jgi:hypothetical protein